MPHKQKSFTLIEMLIVVVIIGILAAALIPRLQSVQARARDTKRKADLHQIATALEIYKEDNGSYDGISDSPTDIGIYNWRPGNQRAITSLSNYANFYSVTDRSDTAFRVYNILEKYMTSIPTDASNTSWKIRRKDIMGYAATTMNNTIPSLSQYATHNGTVRPLNAVVLTSRMESDGSSSNWVINTDMLEDTITGNTDNRVGAIIPSDGCSNCGPSAKVYQEYLCSKVIFDSGTRNDGAGNCGANKDKDDLRYIYLN